MSFKSPDWWRVTDAMKEAGAAVIIHEFGERFIPAWLDEGEIAERVFLAMYAAGDFSRLDTSK